MLLTPVVLHIFLLCFTLIFCWQIQITVLILQICHPLIPSQLPSGKKGDKICNTSNRRVLCIHRIQYIIPVLQKWNWSLTLWNVPPWILNQCAKWIENNEQEGCSYIRFVWLWAFYRCCYKEQIQIKIQCGIMNEWGMWHI